MHSTTCAVAALTLLTAHLATGQEAALPPCVAGQSTAIAATPKLPTAELPQFYDDPQFTVAGVADASQTGGHGSDTMLRTTETLAKDTVALHAPASGGDSEESLRAALEQDPRNAGLHHALGDLEEKLGRPLQAEHAYQAAAELNASEVNLFDWGAELLLHRAYDPAGQVFTKGRRLFPGSVRMAMGLGVAAYALGSYDLAAQQFCEASDLGPADPKPYVFLGKLQGIDTARTPGVMERLARFTRLEPKDAQANYYYALGLLKRRESPTGDAARAEALLKKAVQLDPRLALGYLQLGILYADRKDLKRAIEAFQQALKADPELEEAHFRLATAYRLAGESDKAKAELEVYERISRKTKGQIEQSRHEILQFVYSSRPHDPVPPAQ